MNDSADTSPNNDDGSSETPKSGKSFLWLIGIAALLVCGAAAFYFGPGNASATDLARTARMEFRRANYKEALAAATAAFETQPSNKLAMIAGESAQKLEDLETAILWYRRMEEDGSEEYLNSVTALSLLCFNTGRWTEAETAFREALKQAPDSPDLNRWLGTLLNSEGRRFEATRHFFVATQQAAGSAASGGGMLGQDNMEDLFMLANFEAPFEEIPLAKQALEIVPADPIPLLGSVQQQLMFNKYDEAEESLGKIIAAHPTMLQAHAWLGRVFVDSGKLAEMPGWAEQLPEGSDRFAPTWHSKGLWASKVGQQRAAARCFWEAVRLEPNFSASVYQLGLSLVALNEKKKAQPFLDRHKLLSKYQGLASPMYREGPTVETLTQAIDLTEQLGRSWESFGWAHFRMQFAQREGVARDQLEEFARDYQQQASALKPNIPQTDLTAWDGASIDLGDYPLPDWTKSASTQPKVTVAKAAIRFDDIAEEIGLRFEYQKAAVEKTAGLRIFEGTGGGVAAIDFDRDGWSDLYFTQSGAWPTDPTNPGERDQLFRSVGGTTAVNVTENAGLGDADYSQGVTFADLDGDGFPDLYVANLGANRLFHNNGDGTFTETSQQMKGRPAKWTTSVTGVDLNADGLPELFDANYLSGSKVFDLMCGDDLKRVCAPATYDGERCNAWINDGAGGFIDVSEASGLNKYVGKSLGILAADFDGTGSPSLFVSNDGIANFFLTSEGEGIDIRFTESATTRGLAFDSESAGQACMGIAAADFDGDQNTDLFVTNYYEESNTLYRMTSGDLFEDKSREADLRTPSFESLGWGTQAIDANLDGLPDLVVVNGHIDDFSHLGTPYHMPPQFYQNIGEGRFSEIKTDSSDARQFMNKPQLGRGLARLDWNRDGRFDFAVNYLDTPAALAKNNTPDTGKYLTLHLVGIESSRDAIGTVVTVEAGKQKRTIQLYAGDGYHATNQRCLNFGLGSANEISRVTVQWPSGIRQTFSDVPLNSEIMIREDIREFTTVPQ
ncbi:MAG: FG-GAP-like repeat-containing protein [Planctomycetaceae bacterium]